MLKDGHNFIGGLNKDDVPSQLPPGDYIDLLNMRTGSSDEEMGEGNAETLQGEIGVLLDVVAEITYYGTSIGGGFIYSGYEEITIGSQVWMKQNWDEDYPGSKMYDDSITNLNTYGRLYTWIQATSEDFCPVGWHVPTTEDIDTLLTFLGGELIAGGKLKEPSDIHWTTPNTGATDSSGFKGLPGGKYDAIFSLLGDAGMWWIADEGVPLPPVADPATELTYESFLANWQSVIGVDGYYLDVSTDINFGSFIAGYNNLNVGEVLSYTVTGLTPETTYYYRLRAYNEIGSSADSNIITVLTLAEALAKLLDKDGNEYTTVVIGQQEWIIENLKTTTYADDTPITNILGNSITGWVNTDWDTFVSSGANISSAIKATGAYGNAKSNILNLVAGDMIFGYINVVLNSGTHGMLLLLKGGAAYSWINLHDGLNTFGWIAGETTTYQFQLISSLVGTDMDATILATTSSSNTWGLNTTGAYCWYNNDIVNKSPYGALYNWYAVDNIRELVYFERGGVQEVGWRTPTAADWAVLSAYLGGYIALGGKLKELGLSHWTTPNTGATDEAGFKALPAGYRNSTYGEFLSIRDKVYFWSSDDPTHSVLLTNVSAAVVTYSSLPKSFGFSVRCVRDYAHVVSPQYVTLTDGTNIIRKGVRNSTFVVDMALTPLGFAGTESTDNGVTGDWKNLITW